MSPAFLLCVSSAIAFGGVLCGFIQSRWPCAWTLILLCIVPASALGVCGACIAGLRLVKPSLGYFPPSSLQELGHQAIGFTIPAGVFLLSFALGKHVLGRYKRRRPATQDEAQCVKCGYRLRGLTEQRCPECGTPFDPRRLSKPADA